MGMLQMIGSGVGNFLGGTLGGQIIGGLGAGADQRSADAFNSDQAAISRDWSEKMSGTTYQRTMADMKAAGLNPMLAYSQGGSSVPTGSTASFTSNVDQSNSSSSGATSARASERSSFASERSAGASETQAIAAVKNANTAAARAEAEIHLAGVNADKIQAEIKNIPLEGKRLEKLASMLHEQGQLMLQQSILPAQQFEVFKATVLKLQKETKLLDFDVSAATGMGNIGREAGQLKPLFDLIRGVLRR